MYSKTLYLMWGLQRYKNKSQIELEGSVKIMESKPLTSISPFIVEETNPKEKSDFIVK